LDYLDLSQNQLTTFPILTGLPNLDWIVLSGNQLTAAPDLAGLPGVTTLDLGTNDLTDLSDLGGLPALHWLYLGGNDLQTIDTLTNIPDLYYVDVRYNYLDLSAASQAMSIIQTLTGEGIYVYYQPQRTISGPSLSGAEWLGNGQFQFTISGLAGQVLTVQSSSDLVHWSPLMEVTNTSGTVQFTDNSAFGNATFYRLTGP